MLLEKLLKEFNFSTNIFNWEEFKLFDQYFERILVSKGTFLIKEGETERYSYFVFDGILRCWLLNHNGEEQTFWFCKEGTFSMSNISFTLQIYLLLVYSVNNTIYNCLHIKCRPS